MRRSTIGFLQLVALASLLSVVSLPSAHADTITDTGSVTADTTTTDTTASDVVDPAVIAQGVNVDSIDVTSDPLHGFCGLSYSTSTCTDNGVITPQTGALTQFGFAADPGPLAANHYLVDILVPTNLITSNPAQAQFALDETATSNNTLKTDAPTTYEGLWTSGDLASFVGLNGSKTSPANPISAFEVGTDSSATGFYVYQADLGATTLQNQAGSVVGATPILSIDPTGCTGGPHTTCESIQSGMEIAAFMEGSQNTVATAPSSVIQAQSTSTTTGSTTVTMGSTTTGSQVPEPPAWALILTGFAMFALASWKKSYAPFRSERAARF